MKLTKDQRYSLFDKLSNHLSNTKFIFDEQIINKYYYGIYFCDDKNKFIIDKIYYLGDDLFTHHKRLFRFKSDNNWIGPYTYYFYYRSKSQAKKHIWLLNHWNKKLNNINL